MAEEIWAATAIIDKLGLFTAECFLKGRAEIIRRQQEGMLELSTPVVKLWEQILAPPREDRIIEVKREVNELLARAGEPPRYPSAVAGEPDGMPEGSPPLKEAEE